MYIVYISTIILTSIVIFIAYKITQKMNKQDTEGFSFKQGLDLTGLPIITVKIDNKKLNFLLDTGSNQSLINMSEIVNLKHRIISPEGSTMKMNGDIEDTMNVLVDLEYGLTIYEEVELVVMDLSYSFNEVKKQDGVQLHGIIGSDFFDKYNYILDYKEYLAYPKN